MKKLLLIVLTLITALTIIVFTARTVVELSSNSSPSVIVMKDI